MYCSKDLSYTDSYFYRVSQGTAKSFAICCQQTQSAVAHGREFKLKTEADKPIPILLRAGRVNSSLWEDFRVVVN